MTAPISIADILKTAGVHTAKPTAPAAPAAPVKTAAAAPAAPVAPAVTAPAAKTAAPEAPKAPEARPAVQYDPNVIKTAAQLALVQAGIVIPDEALAQQVFDQRQKTAEAQKTAEQQAKVAEMHARGALQFHGMTKESTAMNLALAPAITAEDRLHVTKVAAMIGVSPEAIWSRASELKKVSELAAAQSGESWVTQQAGRGARAEDSNMVQHAEGQRQLQEFQSSASAGTRAPKPFGGPEDTRFQDAATLPGNPGGMTHGQQVDQGKGPKG